MIVYYHKNWPWVPVMFLSYLMEKSINLSLLIYKLGSVISLIDHGKNQHFETNIIIQSKAPTLTSDLR